MHVLKFGGSSVANEKTISGVVDIVRNHPSKSDQKIVVVSAQAGVTNQLVKIVELIGKDKGQCLAIIRDIEQRHLNLLKMFVPVKDQPAAFAEVIALCNELLDLVKGCFLVGEVTPRTSDLILSFGERLSAYSIAEVFKKEFGKADYVDARNLIRTNDNFGAAEVNFEESDKLIENYFSGKTGVHVVTGFIASTKEGLTTTLGRSGSDYTAAIIGSAVKAEVVEIWTDVNGMMTADPRFVENATSVRKLSYNEAMELSHFGAKVVFPATMQPLMQKEIPILVKNTFQPEDEGTLISESSSSEEGAIKGITSLKDVALLNVQGSGMVGVAGISARLFTALSTVNINVILISQASSEHSICVVVQDKEVDLALDLLKKEFAVELDRKIISSIDAEKQLAVVAVVGENMRQYPGVSAKIFQPMGRSGINVKAIAQGSSELNISMVIAEADLKKALCVLHQSLFGEELLKLHLYLVGTGAIGSRLIEMLDEQQAYLKHQKVDVQLYGICNSRKMLVSQDKISKDALDVNSDVANLSLFVEKLRSKNAENSLFIDLTASEEPVQFYEYLLNNNVAVVTANKKANTQSMERYRSLHQIALRKNVPFCYETNVGAGLPVINVLQSFKASGDDVLKIEAVLSGTLNFLLSEYDGNKSFSELVRFAKENNYAEPDPRDDLSGMDVARKCLILAREAGWTVEPEEVKVVSLMSDKAAKAVDVQAFFEELEKDDSAFEQQYQEAKKKGKRLRYVASIQASGIVVDLKEVESDSPFFGLKGTENCLCFNTKYYQNYPMVIKGPGAGVDVTAAGVLADIVRIANSWKKIN